MDNKVNDYMEAAFTLTDTFLDDLLANFKSNKKNSLLLTRTVSSRYSTKC